MSITNLDCDGVKTWTRVNAYNITARNFYLSDYQAQRRQLFKTALVLPVNVRAPIINYNTTAGGLGTANLVDGTITLPDEGFYALQYSLRVTSGVAPSSIYVEIGRADEAEFYLRNVTELAVAVPDGVGGRAVGSRIVYIEPGMTLKVWLTGAVVNKTLDFTFDVIALL